MLRCSKAEENDETEGNCEAKVQGHTTNPASLEVAAIADTEDDILDSLVNEEKFINFELCMLKIINLCLIIENKDYSILSRI